MTFIFESQDGRVYTFRTEKEWIAHISTGRDFVFFLQRELFFLEGTIKDCCFHSALPEIKNLSTMSRLIENQQTRLRALRFLALKKLTTLSGLRMFREAETMGNLLLKYYENNPDVWSQSMAFELFMDIAFLAMRQKKRSKCLEMLARAQHIAPTEEKRQLVIDTRQKFFQKKGGEKCFKLALLRSMK